MQRLILSVPAGTEPAVLAAALEAGDVAAVVIVGGLTEPSSLIETAQDRGAAALISRNLDEGGASPWLIPTAADGLHLDGDFTARRGAIEARPEGMTVGATAASRHEAMTLGEGGSDYVWFGTVDALSESAAEMACWWQALFEVPAVLAGPADDASLALMIATRVEFIAVNVFQSNADPAARVASIDALLREGAVTS
ncbi:thiamine-phosphate pyrophosphorylase [Stappia sp. 22II-S9-Z10]|nr:thiamine-phosphate pyrophosphorylase [Stappia sp. 22II-S9-Z10]